jgi:hypothetical protein
MRSRAFPLFAILLTGCTEPSTTEEHSVSDHGAAVEASGNGNADVVDRAIKTGAEDSAQLD